MTKMTRDIHALSGKLDVMAEVLHEKGCLARCSLPELAAFVDINHDTLKSCRRSGRLSRANETKLAAKLDFDIDDPAWVDTSVAPSRRALAEGHNYPGKDCLKEFRHMLRSAHELPIGHFLRVDNRRPELLDSNLAILDVSDSGQQTASDQALRLFFSFILECGYHESGLMFGFCSVRLRFIFDKESRARLNNRLGEKGMIDILNAKLSVRGGANMPEWYLSISDGILKGEYLTTEALCELSGGRMGESFTAELSVRLIDSSLRASCGRELPNDTKRAVIEQLFAEPLKGSNESHGWLTLGKQLLCVVRGDQL